MDSSAALDNGNAAIVLNGGMLQAMAGLDLANPITLKQAGSTFDTNGCTVELDGQISGNGGLIVIDSRNGYGTLFLTGENTYLGTADLEAGTLQLGNPNALGPGSGSLTVNGGELDIDGQSITVGLLGGDGGVITNSAYSTPSTLTVDQDSNAAYYGDIQDGNSPVCVNLCGSGVLVAAGSNQYSGGTDLSSGLLVVTNATLCPTAGRWRSATARMRSSAQAWEIHSRPVRGMAGIRMAAAVPGRLALRADHTGPANRADHE